MHDGARQSLSTKWSELFARNPSHEPTTYKALDDLESNDNLAFLHRYFWDEIRKWTQNDVSEMTRIVHPDLTGSGSIFIGGMNHVLNERILQRNDIQAIITIHPKDSLAWDKENASTGLRRFFPDENGVISNKSIVKYPLIVPLEDDANANLIDYFDETNSFIRQHSVEGGRNVLIHCKSGRSRSVAVLIAYLQEKFCCEKSLAPLKDRDEAKEQMRTHREDVTEAIRMQRLPVVVIMERFSELLALYDLQLIGELDLEGEKREQLRVREPEHTIVPASGSSIISKLETEKKPELAERHRSKVVQTKGGAAVLKICVAWVFFRNNQKPTEAVVHQFFEVNEAYFYELEALTYNGRSYVGSKHACPGLVEFCLSYARGEYNLMLPKNIEEHAMRVIVIGNSKELK
ncbi:unnamed protein product [Clonostachys rosea]|uniref:protein-tyrosine-phosphatase n=1 Tax=Bionectria ochroleuca TaxID=29856 RepID=A0ABY6UI21_BIOOC|nr:unnamed protein product [Clonostachys rosea]